MILNMEEHFLNNCEFKYKELLRKRKTIIEELEGNMFDSIHILDIFKDFCNSCFSMKEWCGLSYKDIDSAFYIDICRGVINGDKHVTIKKNLSTYNSKYYRINISGTENLLQSSTGGYIGDNSHHLYTNPGNEILVVETINGVFSVRDIVNKCIEEWELILSTKGISLPQKFK